MVWKILQDGFISLAQFRLQISLNFCHIQKDNTRYRIGTKLKS